MSALSIYPEIDRSTPSGPTRSRPALRVVPAQRRAVTRPARRPELQRPEFQRPAHQRPVPRAAARPARLTRRGRTLATLTFLGLALAAMIPLSGWATATLSGGTPAPVNVIEVHSGQTLYDIAGQVAKPGQVQQMVYRIEELNSLPSATITEGQKLAIPRG